MTTAAAIYELALAGCVLARGPLVRVGLLGGIGWALVTTPVNPPIPAIGNFALAPALAVLMARSFPTSSLDLAAHRNRT